MNVIPSGSRLNFVASARSAFDFVTNPPYSLWLADQDKGRVTYSRVDLGLAILHDRISYELDLAVWTPHGIPLKPKWRIHTQWWICYASQILTVLAHIGSSQRPPRLRSSEVWQG